jgi:hypothetical protein
MKRFFDKQESIISEIFSNITSQSTAASFFEIRDIPNAKQVISLPSFASNLSSAPSSLHKHPSNK